MQENRKRLLKSVYTVCFSVLTVVVGLLFIAQAWSIFRLGGRGSYTVASISEHFHQIMVPVVFWVLALLVNVVLGFVYPDGKARVKPYFEPQARLDRLKKRLPEKSDRVDVIALTINALALAFAALAVTVSLVYLFDKSYTPALSEEIFVESNGMADRLVRVLIWCGGGMALVVAAVLLGDHFAKKQEERLKREIAENALKRKLDGEKKPIEADGKKEGKACVLGKLFGSGKTVWAIRAAVGIVGIVLVITGISNGGMASVLEKAIKICTQCIGLG